jgi:hypothetical protein
MSGRQDLPESPSVDAEATELAKQLTKKRAFIKY